ncbi:TPA: hypothetical protein ACH3X1_014381 [Trebouxia sp. C0004]
MTGFALQTCQVHAGPRQTATGINSQSPLVHTRSLSSRSFHFRQCNSGPPVRHVCQANDRTAAPVADQAPSPDGSAVLENSEQFQVHLKAAIMDPRVKEQNEVTPEVKTLVDELKSIAPKDRKKITKEGIKGVFNGVLSDFGDRIPKLASVDSPLFLAQTRPSSAVFQQWQLSSSAAFQHNAGSQAQPLSHLRYVPTLFNSSPAHIKAEGTQVLISTEYENQYSVSIPFVIQDGPLAGMKGMQTTIGEYTIDDSEPVRQKIGFTALSLGPNTSDNSEKQKWMEVMQKENDKMDEDGKILLKFPEPMKGFRDFLYFDEQLQMSIGNRGSLTIIQQEA